MREQSDHVRRRVGEVDDAGLVEAGEDLLDDSGGQAGIEQSPDLKDAINESVVVGAVPVRFAVETMSCRSS
ncbi:hypothetical protein ACQGAO_30965 [Rhodococcus sp. 1.20]